MPGPSGGRRRTLPLLLGLTAALVAFVGVFAVGSLNGHSAAVPQSRVLVAARDIQAREVLSSDMVVLASIPASAVPPGAVATFAQIKGQTALVTILKGQALTTNLVTTNPDTEQAQTAYLPIPQGFVARAIPAGELQGVAGYIAPGDYINVLATVSTSLFGDARARQVTKLVFANLHVIRVGPAQPGKSGQQQGVSSSLTVVMTTCDAEMMDWLLANARLTYVLLSYKDYSSPPTAPDASCPSVSPSSAIGPTQVNDRYGFTSA
jgi:pilus assembly protein CpaB